MTKNAGLKQMAAALLAPGVTVIRNVTPVDGHDERAPPVDRCGRRVVG
jgi:hypothetical protein